MNISDSRQALVLQVIAMAAQINTTAELDALLDGPLKQLLHYEIALCGIGVSMDKGCYGHKYHSRGFPLDYFNKLEGPDGTVTSPLMKYWRQTRKPVYFQSGRDDHLYPADWVAIFNQFDLRNTIATATMDRHDVVSNYFIFARLDEEVGQAQADLLDMLTPSICSALVRAMETVTCDEVFAGAVHAVFSRRQREIFQWIYHGKTNWEIGKILGINEETVKYHVEQVMHKLGVKTRAQAVGKALEIGVISAE